MEIIWTVKHFRELTTLELYRLIHLRIEIFSVEQNCPYQDADGKDLDAYHLEGLTPSGELVAYARILPPGKSYAEVSIGRVVTAVSVRGTGLGKKLMKHCFNFIRDTYGPAPIRISAQCYLRKFYSDLGFETVGEDYIEDHIPHVEMLKKA